MRTIVSCYAYGRGSSLCHPPISPAVLCLRFQGFFPLSTQPYSTSPPSTSSKMWQIDFFLCRVICILSLFSAFWVILISECSTLLFIHATKLQPFEHGRERGEPQWQSLDRCDGIRRRTVICVLHRTLPCHSVDWWRGPDCGFSRKRTIERRHGFSLLSHTFNSLPATFINIPTRQTMPTAQPAQLSQSTQKPTVRRPDSLDSFPKVRRIIFLAAYNWLIKLLALQDDRRQLPKRKGTTS